MKKVSLLIGTLGGAMAGYLFSNKKLRDDLQNAKDPEAAAKVLAKHVQRDGKKLATEMQQFMESDEVQSQIVKAKKFAIEKGDIAKKELQKAIKGGKKKAQKSVKKVAKKSAAKAKKAVKRMKTKTRKVS